MGLVACPFPSIVMQNWSGQPFSLRQSLACLCWLLAEGQLLIDHLWGRAEVVWVSEMFPHTASTTRPDFSFVGKYQRFSCVFTFLLDPCLLLFYGELWGAYNCSSKEHWARIKHFVHLSTTGKGAHMGTKHLLSSFPLCICVCICMNAYGFIICEQDELLISFV